MKNRKKMFLSSMVFAVFLLHTFTAFAGTVGNPGTLGIPKGKGAFDIRQTKNIFIDTSFDFEYIFDRDLKSDVATGFEITKAQWYMAGISTTLFERFSPYVKLGVAHFQTKWTEAGIQTKLESDTNFAWCGGGKVLIWDFKRPQLKLTGDAFYRVANLDVSEGYAASEKLSLNTRDSRFLLREWQIALLASTEFDISSGSMREEIVGISFIVPYVGIKYSDMSGRLRQILSDGGNYYNPGKIESDKKIGIVCGCDLVGPESVSVNIEGRFIDETAITAGLCILF